jgi:hypothetical protein
LKQRFLNEILDATRRPGCAALIGQLFPQPGHRPVQLMQLQSVGAIDLIAIQPILAGPVGAGNHEPM